MAQPVCRHFGPCGGCDWQHLAYAEQLDRKQQQLTDLLRAALGSRTPRVEPMIGMRVDRTGWPWGFRHKASFVFGESADTRCAIGHYAAGSRTVVPIVECPVHAPRANQLAFALHDHLVRARVPAAGPSLRGILRHLIVRTTRDDREVVAMLVVTRNEKMLRAPIRAFLNTEEAPDGFYLNIHDRADAFMVGRETMRLAGRSHVKEVVGGVSYLLSPTAFFQTNVEAAETLLTLVLEELRDRSGLRVLDLYSGSGLFTLPLAARGHRVTAIEENAQAIKDAESNLRLNRLRPENVRLLAARVEDALPRATKDPVDAVILDPPRQGCAPDVLAGIFRGAQPPTAIYVSCNPETLAAEMPSILDSGYTVRRVQPIDMFPHTTHIETVVTFSRSSSRRTRASAPAPPDSSRPPARRR